MISKVHRHKIAVSDSSTKIRDVFSLAFPKLLKKWIKIEPYLTRLGQTWLSRTEWPLPNQTSDRQT